MREEIRLGRLTRVIREEARWVGQDDFPASQDWADEVEQVLQHLECHGMFSKFLPALRADNRQRDAAMAEARVAFWFCRNGFRITRWFPQVTKRAGDLEVVWSDGPAIFVEVKCPTWQSELTKEELQDSRKFEPRYKNGEARSLDQDRAVLYAAQDVMGLLEEPQ